MDVVVICRFNQLRSILISNLLAQFFPQYTFHSLGTEAIEGLELPKITYRISENWGISSHPNHSRNIFDYRNEILGSDLVICMDFKIERLIQQIGYDGPFLNLGEISNVLGIELVEPIGRSQCEVEFEISKYLFIALTSFSRFLQGRKFENLEGIQISKNEDSYKNFLSNLSSDEMLGQRIFLTDLEIPLGRGNLQPGVILGSFRRDSSGSYSLTEDADVSPDLIFSRYPVLDPAKAYLDQSWGEFLSQIRIEFGSNLVFVTPPLLTSAGYNPLGYLSLSQVHLF